MKARTATNEQVFTPALTVYKPRTRYEFPPDSRYTTRIPEVRSSIRGQIKLLNSLIAIVWQIGLTAIAAVGYCWYTLAESCSAMITLTLIFFAAAILLLTLALHFAMKVSLGEIIEQVKKLNSEVR